MSISAIAWMKRNPDLLFVAALLGSIFMIFIPLPASVVDLMLVVSIALSVQMLLSTIYAKEPARFSSFPSLLLVVTAFRLSLNIATTRLVLTHGHDEGTLAAGHVVRSFGEFVAGKEPVAGLVIFLILVIVNFVVIAKGAGRISEVAARFTLDAMPGKQMAIDAELTAGQITADQARVRRADIARDADFYGAMDGATKFIRGDAIAGLLITAVNIVGGLLIGTLKYGMPLSKAMTTYTLLTIGDGLVSQLPALLVALGAGLMVTRAASASNLARECVDQIVDHKRALRIAAGFLGLLALTAAFMGSGLPWLPLVIVATVLLVLAGAAGRREDTSSASTGAAPASKPESLETLLRVEPLELEIGFGLIRLVNNGLTDRLAQLRRDVASDLGIVVPSICVRDSSALALREFAVKIRGEEVSRSKVAPDDALISVVAGVKQVIHQHAADLLTRDDVAELLKVLRQSKPALVEEVVPALVKPGELQVVLQNLLREGVTVRDLGTIVESVADASGRTKDHAEWTDAARSALARTLCRRHLTDDGKLFVVTLDPAVEDRFGVEGIAGLEPVESDRLSESLGRELERLVESGHPPVLLCAPHVRSVAKRLVDAVRAGVSVLSTAEVVRGIRVEPSGVAGIK